MASPNNYLTSITASNITRTWFRLTVAYDSTQPPWVANGAGYSFRVETATSAGGPFTLATLTGPAECSGAEANPNALSSVSQEQWGIGAPHGSAGALNPGTQYWVRVTVLDPGAAQVDQWVQGPFTTATFPTPSPFTNPVNTNDATAVLGVSLPGRVSVAPPCDIDQANWEIATDANGPFTATGFNDVNSLSPNHQFTGLQPGTNYFWRAQLRDVDGHVYYSSPVQTFQTDGPADYAPSCAVPANPALITDTSASVSGTASFVPTDHTIRLVLATTSGGPYTAGSSVPQPGTTLPGQSVAHTFSGLTAATTYYFRTEVVGPDGTTVVQSSTECTFTTDAASVPPFNPDPCTPGEGGGGTPLDVENVVLCDLDASGNLLGTALAVYDYSDGVPSGAPTFVDPATGNPYVPQGTLQVCPDAACLPPMQFCQTGTTTGPVEHPGRQYDITLPINQGFAVDSLTIDAVTHPAGITWSIFDVDGSDFATALQSFIQGRVPAGATVTVNNPNAGVTEICGAAQPMTVHIECIRLDQTPPNLIELQYNGGEDLIQNPAYNTTPPTDLSQFQFYYLQRQDAGGTVNCTSTANRGWETNDLGPNNTRDFEIWGTGPSGLAAIQNTTATPRGTPVQEVTADINDTGAGPTIWQTFNVTSPGSFRVQLVHGARDTGETHTIRLSTGDTNDGGPGDIINNVTNPPSVTNSGGPNPWTVLDQTVALNSGLYTFSFQTTNPVGPNRGGLFTDMRVYVDRPGLRATAVNNDDTCSVTTDETQTTTTCSFWQPQCVGGVVAGWEKVDSGERLTNAEFWAQVPTPSCCGTEEASGDGGTGGTVQSNMLASDIVCVTIGGIRSQAVRYVVTDPSGGVLQEQFIGANGAPVSPDSWTAGDCTSERYVNDEVLCDLGNVTANGPQPFLRKYVQIITATGQPQITAHQDYLLDASATYTPVGPVGACSAAAQDTNLTLGLCLADGTPIGVVMRADTETGALTQVGWINLLTGAFTAGLPPVGAIACGEGRSITTSGILCSIEDATGDIDALVIVQYTYDDDGNIVSTTLRDAVTGAVYVVPAGHTVTVCPTGNEQPDADLTVLCDDNGSFIRDYRRDETGAVVAVSDYTLAGAPYAPVGTVRTCVAEVHDTEVLTLCDVVSGTPIPFLRRITFNGDGTIDTTVDTTPSGAPYVVTGTVAVCTNIDTESQVLCDIQANGTRTPFLRRYSYNAVTGLQVGTNDTTLNGSTPYVVTGTVGQCPDRDSESFILCDSAATPNRFVRTYTYNAAGAVSGFTDTTLAGAAFVPTGTVQVCPQTVQSDTDFVEEVLCDSNGTAFIRLFRFNSTTGALVSTTNTTLAGAAFVPVGTVGLCSDCCPAPIAEGCTNTGSGRYVAIRASNGTISLIDAITGAAITQANIVACSDGPVETLTAQARQLTNATPWTPGADVTGVLTSLTVTGLSGLWDMVDANGTALTGLPAGLTLTWEAEDANTLSGPQSVTPQAGASVVANWTQR